MHTPEPHTPTTAPPLAPPVKAPADPIRRSLALRQGARRWLMVAALALTSLGLTSVAAAQGGGATEPGTPAATSTPGAGGAGTATTDGAPPEAAPTPTSLTGSDPGQLANDAVQAWLARTPVTLDQLGSMNTTQLCQALPDMVTHPAPQPGTKVNLDDRQLQPTNDSSSRRYTYSAVRPGDQLDVVEVDLSRQGDGWKVDKVGYRTTLEPQGVRQWLQGRTASWLFVAFTLLVLYGLVARSPLRAWLREGWANLRAHRRLVIGTLIFLYAMFGLGALVGAGLPKQCEEAIVSVVTTAVTSLGATAAYGSGDIVRAAVTTFYQNFVVVTLSVTFTLALLFGIPAYLLSAASYFVQGIPFGLLGTADPAQLVMVLVLLVLELTSYFVVVAGGGMFLATLVRQGFASLPKAFRKLALTLPFAMVILLISAWYEAFIVLRFGG